MATAAIATAIAQNAQPMTSAQIEELTMQMVSEIQAEQRAAARAAKRGSGSGVGRGNSLASDRMDNDGDCGGANMDMDAYSLSSSSSFQSSSSSSSASAVSLDSLTGADVRRALLSLRPALLLLMQHIHLRHLSAAELDPTQARARGQNVLGQ